MTVSTAAASLERADSPVRVDPAGLEVLLANPAAVGTYRAIQFTMAPLGVLCVAAHAERHGFDVTVDDRNVALRSEPFSPDRYGVVGIHSDSTRYYRALDLAKQAKEAGAVVVMGGPHPCYVEEEVLRTGSVDYIVRGEGEKILVNLLQALRDGTPPDDVRGISFVRDRQVVRTPPETAITDLDSMPLPARHLVDMDRYRGASMHGRPIANVHTSRGCPFKCSFCSSSWFDGVKWRARTPGSIVDEVQHLVERYEYRAIAFVDDLFTMDPRRVVGVAEELIARRLDVWWWCFCRADALVRNEEMVRLMARSGCRQVFIGVESASEAVLLEYNKKMALDDPRLAVVTCRRHGIEVLASYIIGGVHERRRDVLRTIRYARELDSDTAQFSLLTPFPGTELWGQVQQYVADRDWTHYTGQRAILDLPHLSQGAQHSLLVRAYAEFYLRSRKKLYGFYRFLRARRFGLNAAVEATKSALFR